MFRYYRRVKIQGKTVVPRTIPSWTSDTNLKVVPMPQRRSTWDSLSKLTSRSSRSSISRIEPPRRIEYNESNDLREISEEEFQENRSLRKKIHFHSITTFQWVLRDELFQSFFKEFLESMGHTQALMLWKDLEHFRCLPEKDAIYTHRVAKKILKNISNTMSLKILFASQTLKSHMVGDLDYQMRHKLYQVMMKK